MTLFFTLHLPYVLRIKATQIQPHASSLKPFASALRLKPYALRIIRTNHNINNHSCNGHIKPEGPSDSCQLFMFIKSFLEGPLQSEEHKGNNDPAQNDMAAQNKI